MTSSARTNQQWIDELSDAHNPQRQAQAHLDLANYLYIIAYNYLRKRQSSVPVLSTFAHDELANMAQDFVQEILIKLSNDNFALLKTFRGDGKFLSWCARMVCNAAAGELRRPYWKRRQDEDEEQVAPIEESPEQATQLALLRDILEGCLNQLPERQRIAFQESIIHELSAYEIAQQLGVKEDAVYQLVYRARKGLRRCIERHGINPLDFMNS